MSKFTDLLADPSAERRFLAILEPYDPAAGAVVPVHLSSHGFTSGPAETPASVYFEGRIADGYSFKRSLFAQGRLSGRSIPNEGTLTLSNPDGGLDRLAGYGWGGRRVRVFLGGPDFAFSDYGQVFEGTAQGLAFGDADITVNLRDLSYLFDREIQTAVFAGTGGAEGVPALKSKPKPDGWGICRGVEPVYLGQDTGRDLCAVGSGPIVAVLAVYDRGVPLTYAAAPDAGQWTANLDTGVITLGGTANGPVTVDFIGKRYLGATSTTSATVAFPTIINFQVATGLRIPVGAYVRIARTSDPLAIWMNGLVQSYAGTTLRVNVIARSSTGGTYTDWTIGLWGTVAGILRTMAAGMGTAAIDDAALDDLDLLRPDPVGFWLPEGGNGLQVLDAVSDGAGCYWGFNRAGAFGAGRVDPPAATPVAGFDATQIQGLQRLPTEEPASFYTLRFQRRWRPLTADQVAGSVVGNQRAFAINEWAVESDYKPDVQTAYPLAKPLVMNTILDTNAGLFSEITRQENLFGVRRDYYQVRLKLQALAQDLGKTVRITHPRYNLSAGRNFRVVDLDEDLDDGEITLGIWG